MNEASAEDRAFVAEGNRPSRLWWSVFVAACFVTLVPLLVPVLTPRDPRLLMYPYGAALDLPPAALCVLLARRNAGTVRAQWLLLAAQFVMRSLSLWAPTLHLSTGWPSTRIAAWLISGFSSTSFAFCLMAVTALAGKATRSKRILDACMTLILCGLNFLTAFSKGPSGFSNSHLQVSFLTVVFLLLSAETARRIAVTPPERQFATVTTIFLVCRVIALFFINIVGALWLTTPRELPFDLLYGTPALCFTLLALHHLQAKRPDRQIGHPPALLGSLLPSIVLFASIGLALHAFSEYPILCSVAIGVSAICFVLRTHLLYQRMLREQQELIARTGQLEALATRDALTGIGNRRWLEQMAAPLLEGTAERPVALLLLDADRFKWINDTFGHRAGDDLLLAMSDVLREEIRRIDGACCARIGGDEFVVLLPCMEAGAAKELAERLRRSVEAIPLEKGSHHASVSTGVAVTSGHVSLASLLELADEALYRAKRKGRNVVEMADEDGVAFAQSRRHSEERRFRA